MILGIGGFQDMEKDNEQRKSLRPSKDRRSRLGEQGWNDHYDDDEGHGADDNENDNGADEKLFK